VSAHFQVCKFTKLKNLKKFKLIILQLYKLQVCICKFTSLQVYRITKSRNYKLIVTNLQLNKLQMCICKFMQVCKFTKSRKCKLIITNLQLYKLQVRICKYAKPPHYQITKCKIIKFQIACAHL
jgi:hypothetical protein